jgi:hypothetical protein
MSLNMLLAEARYGKNAGCLNVANRFRETLQNVEKVFLKNHVERMKIYLIPEHRTA